MEHLDIMVEASAWDAETLEQICLSALRATLSDQGLNAELCEVSVLACDDDHIAGLNADFRGKPQPTNVLSWPAEELAAEDPGGTPVLPKPGPDGLFALGDIAISYDTCAAEAAAADKTLSDHATHLLIHACLHLLGYDHEIDADAALMEGLEVKILGKMGINDPYKER